MAADPRKLDARILEAGAPLSRAKAVMIMLHGRGAAGEDMLRFAEVLAQPDFAVLAPQAEGRSWYPFSFLAPIKQNEPYLSSAMLMLDGLLARLISTGFAAERTVLFGFSQGACLALEYAARYARRYGGIVGLSGGLIGPEGTPRDYPGDLSGTPVFLGCGDTDPHIPAARVRQTDQVLTTLGGVVRTKLYRDMGHTINDDEISHMRPRVRPAGRSPWPDGASSLAPLRQPRLLQARAFPRRCRANDRNR
jgi:phospholipase/carboxylesterase